MVTGAAGFVGRRVIADLAVAGWSVRAVVRRLPLDAAPAGVNWLPLGDLAEVNDWSRALIGAEAVVHLAARVHVMRESALNPLAEFRRANVRATEALAGEAVRAGVRHFVFVSTAKVNGESTNGQPFSERDDAQPQDNYARSKWEAEQRLANIAEGARMAVTILRPPLMYGPGVKGNFLSLLRLVDRQCPLPLASVRNARSMLYVGNLADAVTLCLRETRSGVKTYLLGDGEDVSTPELIRCLATALKRKSRLFPVPVPMLQKAAWLFGQDAQLQRLTGSLQLDVSRIKSELGWCAPFALRHGLADTVSWYEARSS